MLNVTWPRIWLEGSNGGALAVREAALAHNSTYPKRKEEYILASVLEVDRVISAVDFQRI